jgi:tetratricopeptide (TPR) repeat protein
LGGVYKSQGEYTLALRSYRKALKISKDIGNQYVIVDSHFGISAVSIEIGEFSRAKSYLVDGSKTAAAIFAKDREIERYIALCRINVILGNYIVASDYCEKGIKITKELKKRWLLLQLYVLGAEINYYEKKYLKSIKIADKTIKLAKEMGTKDLFAEALLLKAKNGVEQDILSKVEIMKTLNDAKQIAEEIGCPEVLWKVYFEYGRFFQSNKQYPKALEYYQKCNRIFETVISKIKNERYKKSYLNRPDRLAVRTAVQEIGKLLD